MLTEKLVEIKISKQNIAHYLNYGYTCILGNRLLVESKHVISTVATRIYVLCSNCKSEKYIQSCNYYNQLKKSNFYVCQKCNRIKANITCIKKYGTSCPLQNEEVALKSKETMLDEYGVDNISKVDHIRESRRDNFKTNEFKEKSIATWIDKYGVTNPSQSDIIKKKKEETTFKNYGVLNPSQSPEIFEKAQISGKKLKKHECGLFYRGTYEKHFLDYCVSNGINIKKGPTINYLFNGSKYYHSDFYIEEYNLIVEIKSSYYFEIYKEKNEQKRKDSEKYFNFLFIIDRDYTELENILK